MRIGIDLGGTKIEGIALDGSARSRGCASTRRAAITTATLDALVARWCARSSERDRRRAASVGVGIPGTLSPETGLVKNANSMWLIGQPLQRRSRARISDAPVRIANDANCFAVSEATDGAGAGADVVFGVIVGTGTGGGIVVRGEVLTGRERRSPASGGTIRCRGRPTTSGPGRLLLRPVRVHRDVPVGPRPAGRLRACDRAARLAGAEIVAAAAAGDRDGAGGARALRSADGARAGQRHQRARSRRHRARRRHVEYRPAVSQRAGVVDGSCIRGGARPRSRSHATRPRSSRRRQRRARRGMAVERRRRWGRGRGQEKRESETGDETSVGSAPRSDRCCCTDHCRESDKREKRLPRTRRDSSLRPARRG